MEKIYLINSYWDILGMIIMTGLAMIGCLALLDEYLKKNKKK